MASGLPLAGFLSWYGPMVGSGVQETPSKVAGGKQARWRPPSRLEEALGG